MLFLTSQRNWKFRHVFIYIVLDKVNKFELGIFQKYNEKVEIKTIQQTPNLMKKTQKYKIIKKFINRCQTLVKKVIDILKLITIRNIL